MSQLVIVESAAKAKTIEKYLQSIPELQSRGTFKVMASLGHIRDLPSKDMGVDTESWKVNYVVVDRKASLIKALKQAAKEAQHVYLASDLDFEGEAIAHHLRDELGLKQGKYDRVRFNEITKTALREAFLHPTSVNDAQVRAQETRRILDRVVGYELSPLLWRRFATSSLSAGRVQSAALKMLVDRKKEIEEHQMEVYWKCGGTFTCADVAIVCALHCDDKAYVTHAENDIQQILEFSRRVKDWKATFSQKVVRKSPPAPFTTSTLQQEVYDRYSIPAKRTMQIAQGLYESGLITYMRTDSTNLSEDASKQIAAWVCEHFGSDLSQPRTYTTKNAHAQEAHEAIRPTQIGKRTIELSEKITSGHQKVYELIWRRTVASQMAPAKYAEVTCSVSTPTWSDYTFDGKVQILIEEGFMKVANPDAKATPEKLSLWQSYLDTKEKIPVVAKTFEGTADVTRPPSHFYEASLVKAMEKSGIGRPSTYATIIDKLHERGYVAKGANPIQTVPVNNFQWTHGEKTVSKEGSSIQIGGKEADRMIPTSLGERVADYLHNVVPSLLDLSFTSSMEALLDDISHSRTSKEEVLRTFYSSFHEAVSKEQAKQKELGSKSKPKVSKSELAPKSSSKTFPELDVSVVSTRYGPALFHAKDRKFTSLDPFLAWKGKAKEQVDEKDVRFLMSLPLQIEGSSRMIAYGRYGLYVKDGDKNIPLPKELWDVAYDGKITAEHVEHLTPKPKSSWKKRAAS